MGGCCSGPSRRGCGWLGYGCDGVSPDGIVPAALVLGGIDVERDVVLALVLNVELTDAVFAKDVKDHSLRVLAWHFKYIFLAHP